MNVKFTISGKIRGGGDSLKLSLINWGLPLLGGEC